MCIKLSNGTSTPSTGTWELICIYGPFKYLHWNNITHYDMLLFLQVLTQVGHYLDEDDPLFSGSTYVLDATYP